MLREYKIASMRKRSFNMLIYYAFVGEQSTVISAIAH